MLNEFKEFAMKGNVVDMAVGIIIGAAFGTIIKSLVSDVLMPPLGLLIGDVDFSNLFVVLKEGTPPAPYETVALAAEAGAVTINWGILINNIISFILVAIAVFFVIKWINNMRKEEEAPEADPEPSNEEKLLTEIRDLLSK